MINENKLPTRDQLVTGGLVAITNHHKHVITNSLQVAAHFGKRASNVSRRINGLMKLGVLKIEPTYYLDKQNKTQRYYELNRDQFLQVALGFTGEKAELFKRDFIELFNQQEKELNEWRTGRIKSTNGTKEGNEAIQRLQQELAVELPTSRKPAFLYVHIQNAINKAVTGSSKTKREEMTTEQLKITAFVEGMTAHHIEAGFKAGMTAEEIRKRLLDTVITDERRVFL